MKAWWRSRTLWVGVAAVVTGIGIYLDSGNVETLLTSITGLLMIVFRILTDQALATGDAPKDTGKPTEGGN